MATYFKFSGWWRLWAFLSAIWLVSVGAVTYSVWPVEDQADHHPAFIYQLDRSQRELLVTEGATSVGATVEMPNGYLLQFKPEIKESVYAPVARAYHQASVAARSEDRRNTLKQAALAGVLPPFLLALLGVGVAWVRQGFLTGRK